MKTKTTTVVGLRDGQYTCGTRYLMRKIRAYGAKVALASTGRVTLTTASGERKIYVLELDMRWSRIDLTQSANSPLKQALADLEA
jgi:hypothetical protein